MFHFHRPHGTNCPWAVAFVVVLAVLYVLIEALYQAYTKPLWDAPGLWSAKFTRLWQLQAVYAR